MRIITTILEALAILCIVAAVGLIFGWVWALVPLALGFGWYAWALRGSRS